ncbi:MAG: hypothetical protein K8R02_06290 [Anaerohalosphaeraceae bacterium]|nr:hypothetical protein [Anaerohalosphaeraceae bacterium]
MKDSCFSDKNIALKHLLDKYDVDCSGVISEQEIPEQHSASLKIGNTENVLLPWRMERRFMELKVLVENGTLENISTLRFCNISSAKTATLDKLIYREMDLCEWIGGTRVKSLFAVFSEASAANIIIKLQNGMSCSVECSVMLPEGAKPVDRHEIIAERGVASDRVVDTQVPQSSIYTFTNNGSECFTDTDAEIFGLDTDSVNQTRAAFKVLSEPETMKEWNQQDSRLRQLVDAAKKSGRLEQVIHCNDGEKSL